MFSLLLAPVFLDETQPGEAFVEVHALTQTGVPVFDTLESASHIFSVLLTVICGRDRKLDFGRSLSTSTRDELSTGAGGL